MDEVAYCGCAEVDETGRVRHVVWKEVLAGGSGVWRHEALQPRPDISGNTAADFEWGYVGSGPRQLAASLLGDQSIEAGPGTLQLLVERLVAALPQCGAWRMDGKDLREDVEALNAARRLDALQTSHQAAVDRLYASVSDRARDRYAMPVVALDENEQSGVHLTSRPVEVVSGSNVSRLWHSGGYHEQRAARAAVVEALTAPPATPPPASLSAYLGLT